MSATRILFVVYELPPLGGGVATAASHLLREFAKEKHLKIDVVTSSLINQWETEKFSENITIYKVPIGQKNPENYQKQTAWEMMRFTLSSTFKISSLLRKNEYKLAHYFGYPGALPGLIFKRRVPYIVSLRGVDVPGYNKKYSWYYMLYKPLSKLIWKHAEKVIANSQWLADLAKKTLEREILIIPNGVDTQKFKPVPESEKFDVFTVTAGGTVMGPKKGLEYLVEGFAEFHKKHPDSKLLLIGGGVLEEKLRQRAVDLEIKDAVEFTGKLEHGELAKVLPKCHVMCLPSLAEGMSNAVLEAAACGLPLILTNVGGTMEVLDGNGCLVKKRNTKNIVNALTKIFKDKAIRMSMVKKSRSKAVNFNWRSTRISYLELEK